MRLKLPILGPADLVPHFEAPSFLEEVANDSAGVDDTLSSIDLLLTAVAASSALEDGLLGQFALDLVNDSPTPGELGTLDPSPLVADHAGFVGQGDTLMRNLGGSLTLPPAPRVTPPPTGGGGAQPRGPAYRVPPVIGSDIPTGQFPGQGEPSCFGSASCGPDGPYTPPPITGEPPGGGAGEPAPGSEGEPLPENTPAKE